MKEKLKPLLEQDKFQLTDQYNTVDYRQLSISESSPPHSFKIAGGLSFCSPNNKPEEYLKSHRTLLTHQNTTKEYGPYSKHKINFLQQEVKRIREQVVEKDRKIRGLED